MPSLFKEWLIYAMDNISHFVYPSLSALMSRASRDMGTYSVCGPWFPFLLGANEGAELLGHMAILWFKELLFSTLVAQFTAPPAMSEGCSFSIFSPNLLVFIKNVFFFHSSQEIGGE